MTDKSPQLREPYIWKVYKQFAGYPAYPGDSDTSSTGCEIVVARNSRSIDSYEIVNYKRENHQQKMNPLLDRFSIWELLAKEAIKSVIFSQNDLIVSKVREVERRYGKTYCIAPVYRFITYPIEDREIQIFREYLTKIQRKEQ